MAQSEIKLEVETTWVKGVSIFICRYIKSRWLLRKLCKLTVANIYLNGKVIEIKKLLKQGISQYKIAEKYNVSRSAILKINLNKTWKQSNKCQ